ncbi:MAG: ShlB/FhaC/HecB family hemolysin secretion/activation protein, partial [Pseudomonadota bacterium]
TEVLGYAAGLRFGLDGSDYRVSGSTSLERVESEDILGESRESSFFRGGLSMVKRLSPRSYSMLKGSWQHSSAKLIPSTEVFQIGGLYSVRGHPQGALSGTRGYYTQLEWHWQGMAWAEPFIFADYGKIWGQSPKKDSLRGYGLGLNWHWAKQWSGEITYGSGVEEVIPGEGDYQVYLRLVWAQQWQ